MSSEKQIERDERESLILVLYKVSQLIGETKEQPVKTSTGRQVRPGLSLQSNAALLMARAKDLQQGVFNLFVLGELKSGKSTLLNAMLGQKLLPAKIMATTGIITVLVNGTNKSVGIYKIGQKTPQIVSRETFQKAYQLQKQDRNDIQNNRPVDRLKDISHAQIECDLPLWAKGIQLIDSPSLGEYASRNKTTTNFLPQSQAIIFVLSATKLLGENQRSFIENRLGSDRLNHVFFVVNRINQVDEEEVDQVKEEFQEYLEPRFLDEKGQFDQAFYEHRVFFINALGALDARSVDPIDEIQLEASGLTALERSLEQFLAEKEKATAELQSTVQLLDDIVDKARQKMANDQVSLDQSLVELEKRLPEAEKRLKELEREKEQIEETVHHFGQTIASKIYSNLVNYVNQLPDTWPEDSQELTDLDDISLLPLIAKATAESKPAQRQLAEMIENQFEHYLQVKFTEWSNGIPALVQPDLEQIRNQLETQIEQFELKLNQVRTFFASGETMQIVSSHIEQRKDAYRLQAVLGVGLLDLSQVAGSVLGKGEWSSFFGRLLRQVVIVSIVSSTANLFLGIGIYSIIAALLGTISLVHFKKNILEMSFQNLHRHLLNKLAEKQNKFYQDIESQFVQLEKQITSALQVQIDEVRASQKRIIGQRQDNSVSVEQEKKRLEAIDATLQEAVKLANHLIRA